VRLACLEHLHAAWMLGKSSDARMLVDTEGVMHACAGRCCARRSRGMRCWARRAAWGVTHPHPTSGASTPWTAPPTLRTPTPALPSLLQVRSPLVIISSCACCHHQSPRKMYVVCVRGLLPTPLIIA
jgi:hypothetical protein